MVWYHDLEKEAKRHGIQVVEDSLLTNRLDGIYFQTRKGRPVICLQPGLSMQRKICTLAEELGHYHTCTSNILACTTSEQWREEKRGRAWAFRRMIPPADIISAWRKGARTPGELARYFGLTEEFIQEALRHYHKAYRYRGYHQERAHLTFSPLRVTIKRRRWLYTSICIAKDRPARLIKRKEFMPVSLDCHLSKPYDGYRLFRSKNEEGSI